MVYQLEVDSDVSPMGGQYSSFDSKRVGVLSSVVYPSGTTNTSSTTTLPTNTSTQPVTSVRPRTAVPTNIIAKPIIPALKQPTTVVRQADPVVYGGGGGYAAPAVEEEAAPDLASGAQTIFGMDKKIFWGGIGLIAAIWAYKNFK